MNLLKVLFISTLTFTAQNSFSENAIPSSMGVNSIEPQFIISGIGIMIEKTDTHVFIRDIIHDSPAELDGTLKIGDEIVSIQQDESSEWHNVDELSLADVVQMIRGPIDTTVGIKFMRNHTTAPVFLVRKPVLESEA